MSNTKRAPESEEFDRTQIQLRAAADLKQKILDARESIISLYKLIFTDDTGKPITIKPFHKKWEEGLFTHQYVLYEASRGLTKTSFMIAAVLWMIGRNPNIRIKWLGNNGTEAEKRLALIHEIIDNKDHIYHKVFPHVKKVTKDKKRPNNSTMLNLERDLTVVDPTIQALGVMSSGAGGRADLMVWDDVVDEKNAILNPSMKAKVLNRLQLEWLPLLVKTGRLWCIFTPWAEDDANAWFKANTDWYYLLYTHGTPEDPYHSIFPEAYPRSELLRRRVAMGQTHYARAYLCQAMPPDTVPILPEHLIEYDSRTLTPTKAMQCKVFISVDPASGKKLQKGELDYTGISIIMLLYNSYDDYEIFIPEAFQVNVPQSVICTYAWTLAELWDAYAIIGEDAGMKEMSKELSDERTKNFPHLTHVKVIGSTPDNLSKGQRYLGVSSFFALPEGIPTRVRFHPKVIQAGPQPYYIDLPGGFRREALRDLREQMLSFPTKHDDILDSIVNPLRHISSKYLRIKKAPQKTSISMHVVSFATEKKGKGRRGKKTDGISSTG